MATTSNEPRSETNELELPSADPAVPAGETLHADPLTGEPGAHPAAVGVGALSAGAAGAAIGMFAGPVGAVIGAAIGAVAGGLAGHEVAAAASDPVVPATADLNPEATGSTTDDTGRPSSLAPLPEDALMVFPGSDLGAPTVTAEAADPADPAAEAATDGMSFVTPASTERAVDSGFTVSETSEDMVRKAAYFVYLDRRHAGRPGDELGDWYEAEQAVTRF